MNDLSLMSFREIAATRCIMQNYVVVRRAYSFVPYKVYSSSFSGKMTNFPRKSLKINAIATLESKHLGFEAVASSSVRNQTPENGTNEESEFLMDEDDEVDDKEKLRRLRISKANKGNTPWNKGRKHSPETLKLIRERTKLAMQNPKVKVKLASLGHSQSDETKVKIAVGVRIGWQRRREKLMVQEKCLFDWQNLVAEGSRSGLNGEDELQWDSYSELREKLEIEWVESVETRKNNKSLSSRRAPKSAEQRRKIAEAIAVKWADPEYRERVCTGISKYHGVKEGEPRKPRRQTVTKKQVNSEKVKKTANPKIRRIREVVYKDPMSNSKLEILKDIRARRAAEENKKVEAIARARLLIAEAEKAAKALEVAASRSPVARASLDETRKLIAEAVRSIESINGNTDSQENQLLAAPNGVNGQRLPNGVAFKPQLSGINASTAKKWVSGRLVQVTNS